MFNWVKGGVRRSRLGFSNVEPDALFIFNEFIYYLRSGYSVAAFGESQIGAYERKEGP